MERYYLGGDVSKGYADFVILDCNKACVKRNFQLDDTFAGHSKLYDVLCMFLEAHPGAFIYAGLESTGGYENNWFHSLKRFSGALNLEVTRLNPLGVNSDSKAELQRNITDKISARSVAEYMIGHSRKVSYDQKSHYASLKKHWSFVRMLTKQKTQLLNQLESLVYNANPELLSYCKNSTPEWVLTLLVKYPTALKLSKAKASSVAKIKQISPTLAKTLIKNAKRSVACSTDDLMGEVIVSTVKQILVLMKNISYQISRMIRHCNIPEVDILKTFGGIGDYSAIGLVFEIGQVARFDSAKKISSFFGLHPIYKLSGDGTGRYRMSKKGKAVVREILFMVAMNAIQHNTLIKAIYWEHVNNGMSKMAALGLCMHKILRIIYGMLKNNTPFDPEIDRKNREKSYRPTKRVNKNLDRRYQHYDNNAPISRRQHKKRKEQRQSQSDIITKREIKTSVLIKT